MSDDRVWCWGVSQHGLGNGAATVASSSPVLVDFSLVTTGGTPQEVALSRNRARRQNVAVRMSTGHVVVWGDGEFLVHGSTASRARPAAAVTMTGLGGATFTSIVGVDDAFCGLASDSTVWCWGRRKQGSLGDGQADDVGSPTAPVKVMGLPSTISAIFGGHRAACAIDGDKRLWCWGNNRRGHITRQPVNTLADSMLLTARDVTP